MKKAFTLAEIMIVLMVIGILTAILLPSARNAIPNEDVMKFKKAHNTLHTTIREMVNSDEYFLDGDLGVKSDGSLLKGEEARKYLCQVFSDIVGASEVNCSDSATNSMAMVILNKTADMGIDSATDFFNSAYNGSAITKENTIYIKERLDRACLRNIAEGYYKQIVTSDGSWFYDNAPGNHFGTQTVPPGSVRVFSPPNQPANIKDDNGFDTVYKVFCLDIDGIPENATRDDCVNECPFGYGIRGDGKILNGARADEWLEKSVQEK